MIYHVAKKTRIFFFAFQLVEVARGLFHEPERYPALYTIPLEKECANREGDYVTWTILR